jgi:SDR family mycofactocin-dependent oxidoreductase
VAKLRGKVALITGGARGQGRSHALALAREGCDIALCDIVEPAKTPRYRTATEQDRIETERLVLESGQRCLAVEADVRDRSAMDQFVARTISELGTVDIVVANAGILNFAPAWEITGEEWDEIVAINLTGVWNVCRAAMPYLIQQRRGNIVMTSSNAGLKPMANVAPYVAAKHGVTGLMKALAVELSRFNIRVNAVHPCSVATDMVVSQSSIDLFAGKKDATFKEAEPGMKSLNLLDVGLIEPQDVSDAILYLVSDGARYVTGLSLTVDAGSMLVPPGHFRDSISDMETQS